MKLLKEDTIFSKFIKKRDKYTCQRCKKRYSLNDRGLTNSHFWSRRNWTVRFSEDNCDTLCWGCHNLWEHDKQGDYMNFKIKQLGIKGYEILEKLARMTIKDLGITKDKIKKNVREKYKSIQD